MAPKLSRKQALSLLYVLREAGAAQGVIHTTMDEYMGQLHKAGLLTTELRDKKPGEDRDTMIVLTEAGITYLKEAGK